jgi:hypothetical protein
MFFSQWLQQRPVILVAFHTLNNVPDFLPYYSVTELLCTSPLLLNDKNSIPFEEMRFKFISRPYPVQLARG